MKKRFHKFGICLIGAVMFTAAAKAEAEELLDGFTRTVDDDGNLVCDFAQVQVVLPGSWAGKYGVNLQDDFAMFYHIGSMEAANAEGYVSAGHMFTVNYSEDYEFADYQPSYSIIGSTAEGVYYVTYPTDVQGFGDEAVLAQWREMSDDLEWIREHIILTADAAGDDFGVPVMAAVQLYEGDYQESEIFSGESMEEEYYTLSISRITNTSFEFTIRQVNGVTGEAQTVFLPNTAYFEDDGKTAAFYGKEYTLKFDFPDNHGALPAVTDIVVTGYAPIEGKTMVNNGVPGHEFS